MTRTYFQIFDHSTPNGTKYFKNPKLKGLTILSTKYSFQNILQVFKSRVTKCCGFSSCALMVFFPQNHFQQEERYNLFFMDGSQVPHQTEDSPFFISMGTADGWNVRVLDNIAKHMWTQVPLVTRHASQIIDNIFWYRLYPPNAPNPRPHLPILQNFG